MVRRRGRDVALLPASGVRADRRHILRWCRKVNAAVHDRRRRVGGVVTAQVPVGDPDAGETRRCLRSVISGEVRWFPEDATDDDGVQEVYEWAREEIMCSFSAGVEILIIDEIGPEVIHGLALDSALRACLWKAAEEELRTQFVVIADPSLIHTFGALYGLSSNDRLTKLSSFREYLRWEAAPDSARQGLRKFSWSRPSDVSTLLQADDMDTSIDTVEEERLPGSDYDHKYQGSGPFYSLVRFPLLAATLWIIFMELAGYIFVRQLVNVFEGIFRRNRPAYRQLKAATSYSTWRRAARQLDVTENKVAGNIGHIPTILQFTKSIKRLTRQLTRERHVRAMLPEDTLPDAAEPHALDAAGKQISILSDASEVVSMAAEHERDAISASSDSDSPASAVQREEQRLEHELLGCLRACTSSLVELVNEHVYSMNHVGINLEMRDCVRSYISALEEIEATENPEILKFRAWQEQRRKYISLVRSGHLLTNGANGASRIPGSSLWRSTVDALRKSSPSGGGLFSRLGNGNSNGTAEANGLPPRHETAPTASRSHRLLPKRSLQDKDTDNDTTDDDDDENDKVPSKPPSPPPETSGNEVVTTASEAHSDDDADDHADSYSDELRATFAASKARFFSELAHSYGETALCLSGGAANAYYHLGVVKTLLDGNMLPMHITGASGGALMGSFVCTRTDEELREALRPEFLCKVFDPCSRGLVGMFKNMLHEGTLFNVDEWIDKMVSKVCGTMTFQEAFEKTGRSFTITVYNIDARGRNHTRVLNYKTTPDVVIYSAVLASSALPKLLPPIELLRKDARGTVTEYHSLGRFWRDGSFENELPLEALRQLFNVTFPIVSQVEPHISPFFYDNRGAAGKSVSHRGGRGWRGGFLLAYFERLLKLDLKKWLELVRDFHLLPKVYETDISSVFLGKTRGACTIVPPIMLRSYTQLVSDPNTPAKMRGYLQVGQQMTWPKLGMIHDRLEIERKLQHFAY